MHIHAWRLHSLANKSCFEGNLNRLEMNPGSIREDIRKAGFPEIVDFEIPA